MPRSIASFGLWLEQLVAELTASFEAHRQRGEIDCPDVGMLVLNLIAVAHSLATFERMGAHHGEFSKPLVADLARLVWSGIAPEQARERPKPLRKSPRERGLD